MVRRPTVEDKRLIKNAYKGICEGRYSLNEAKLDNWQRETLVGFMKCFFPDKSILALSAESKISLMLCDDLKSINKRARRTAKESKYKSSITLSDGLLMRLNGAVWHEIVSRGASAAQIKQIREFLKFATLGTGLEEISEKLKINKTEAQLMKKVLKENKKSNITV